MIGNGISIKLFVGLILFCAHAKLTADSGDFDHLLNNNDSASVQYYVAKFKDGSFSVVSDAELDDTIIAEDVVELVKQDNGKYHHLLLSSGNKSNRNTPRPRESVVYWIAYYAIWPLIFIIALILPKIFSAILPVWFSVLSVSDIFRICLKYRTTPEKDRKARENAKRKLDEFLDEVVEEYNRNHRKFEEARLKEEARQKQKYSYWEEQQKFSQPSPSNMMEKHQKILGIPMGQRLNKTLLMTAYKKAAIKSHPDKGGSKEAFIAVQQAKDYLEKFV